MGNIYVGTDIAGLFKIGITDNPEKRLKQLKTGNPNFWFLFVFDVENSAIEEVSMQTLFRKKRVCGEWYALNAKDLCFIANKYWKSDYPISIFENITNLIEKKRNIKMSYFDELRGLYE